MGNLKVIRTIALSTLLACTPAFADEFAAKAAAQKKTAVENWTSLEIGESAAVETPHLIVIGPKSQDRRLKELGTLLEKAHEQARSVLKFEDKEPWTGKLTVYLFWERDPYPKFVRRIEKKRSESEDSAGFFLDADAPHVAACPSKEKRDPGVEGLAAEQIAAALIQKKVGADLEFPEWLRQGFGRATWHRLQPADRVSKLDRQLTAKLVRAGRTAMDIWDNKLDTEVSPVLRGSFVEFLAYGPQPGKFLKIVEGFKPTDAVPMPTAAQAFEAAGLKAEVVSAKWREWALGK